MRTSYLLEASRGFPFQISCFQDQVESAMADPATILGLISASLTITICAATIGKDLHSLRQKFKAVNSSVQQLSVHISAIRIAARSLSSWLEAETVGSEEVEEVRHELLAILSACGDLLSDLQDHITRTLTSEDALNFKGACKYIWNEDLIKQIAETLHHQETAIILILQTLGQLTRAERVRKVQEPEMVQTLEKAKRPSSSVFGLPGDGRLSVRFSCERENPENLDIHFNFDNEIMASSAYRKAFVSLLRHRVHEQAASAHQVHEDGSLSQNVVDSHIEESRLELDHFSNENTKPRQMSSSASSTSMEFFFVERLENLHHCSKGTRCKKWRKQQAKLELDIEHRNEHSYHNYITQGCLDFLDSSAAHQSTYGRALYDYTTEQTGQLNLSTGDRVTILVQLDDGWCYGMIDERRGWFPSAACK
jgi:hypothetical protein